jgi:hypothetical protein
MSLTSHAFDAVRVQQSALRMVGGAGGDGERGRLQQRVVLKIAAQQMDSPANKTQRFKMLNAFGSIHAHIAIARVFINSWMRCERGAWHLRAAVVVVAELRQALDELKAGGGSEYNTLRTKCGISNDSPVPRARRCRGYRIWGGGAVQWKQKGKRRVQVT